MPLKTKTTTAAEPEKPTNWPALTTDSDYDSPPQVGDYQFMSDAFKGENGFKNGRYLVPYQAETKPVFERRKAGSFYKNYVSPIIRATVEPVFNVEIERKCKAGATVVKEGYYCTAFVENATGNGQDLQSFVEDIETWATIHGVTFVVMDNDPKASEIKQKTVALEKGVYPYVYMRTRLELQGCERDKKGRIQWIRFIDGEQETLIDKKPAKVTIYTYYDNEVIKKQRYDENAKIFIDMPDSEVRHSLGTVPVIAEYYDNWKTNTKGTIDIKPPFYDIARINHAIFNLDSEIRTSERSQGFSLLYLEEDEPGNLQIGKHNYISLPKGTTITPGFASPDSGVVNALMESNAKRREDLFRIAGQHGVEFRSGNPKSAEAMEWEFVAQEVVLKKTARRACMLEYKIMHLFSLYTKEPFTFEVTYPDQFRPFRDETEIADLDKLLLMEMPEKTKVLIKHHAIQLKSKDWPEDEQQIIDDEFKDILGEEPIDDGQTDE